MMKDTKTPKSATGRNLSNEKNRENSLNFDSTTAIIRELEATFEENKSRMLDFMNDDLWNALHPNKELQYKALSLFLYREYLFAMNKLYDSEDAMNSAMNALRGVVKDRHSW